MIIKDLILGRNFFMSLKYSTFLFSFYSIFYWMFPPFFFLSLKASKIYQHLEFRKRGKEFYLINRKFSLNFFKPLESFIFRIAFFILFLLQNHCTTSLPVHMHPSSLNVLLCKIVQCLFFCYVNCVVCIQLVHFS